MLEEIRDYIIGTLLNGKHVADDEDLLLGGLVDSLGVMRLVRHVESAYGLRVPPGDITIENFATIGQIADYLGALRAA